MTINELEQGIRNLIATQPMVTTGATGEVVNGINSIIEACRNLSFRVSTYPCQDVMKFGLANETAKFENTLSNLALQVLQERGINLMLYIPRGGANYGSMVNSFGMVNSPVDANLMMGQMMYTPASMPTGAGMMPMQNTMPNMARPNMGQPAFNQMQPQMVGVAPNPYAGRPAPRGQAPTFPGYTNPDRPIHLEPVQTTAQSMKTRSAPQSKIKSVPKQTPMASVEKNTPEPEPTIPVAEPAPEAPSAAEMLMGGAAGGGGKAQGRDYLMELLKK